MRRPFHARQTKWERERRRKLTEKPRFYLHNLYTKWKIRRVYPQSTNEYLSIRWFILRFTFFLAVMRFVFRYQLFSFSRISPSRVSVSLCLCAFTILAECNCCIFFCISPTSNKLTLFCSHWIKPTNWRRFLVFVLESL